MEAFTATPDASRPPNVKFRAMRRVPSTGPLAVLSGPVGGAPLIGLLSAGAACALDLPALTGRVVDGAGLLRPAERDALAATLKAHEDRTTDQVVVATVPSLQGTSVEDFSNRLFRAWGLGTKARNNGVLFLIAPTERKVRIEVGYGLEGALPTR